MRFVMVFTSFVFVLAGGLLSPRPVHAQVQPPSPALCYDFDTLEDAIGSNDLTLIGSGVSVNNASGAVGNYLRFANDLYPAAEFASPTTSTNDVTVLFWAKDTGAGNGETYIGSTTSTGWDITYWYGGAVDVYSDGSSEPLGDGTFFGSGGYWNFVGVVWDSGTVTATLDDGSGTPVLESFSTSQALPSGTTDNFQVQSDYAGIDQLMVWNEALSPEEIEWVWNNRAGRTCSEMAVAPTPTPTPTPSPTSTLTPTPTATPTPTPGPTAIDTPIYYVNLPHDEARVDIYGRVDAGDFLVLLALVPLVLFTGLTLVLRLVDISGLFATRKDK